MKLIVQNLVIEYQDEGSGDILLFLHGWQDSLKSFDLLTSALSPKKRIIRLDLPGFGKSDISNEAWNIDKYVNFVSNFIKKLDIQVNTIVGHSFGGRIIIKGDADKIFNTKNIILIGSAGVAKRKTFRNYFFKTLAKLGKLITSIPPFSFFRESLRRKMYSYIGSDYINAGTLKETFLKVINEDLSESAKKISTPSLLIWGRDDTETPVTDGERLSGLIQGSIFAIVEDAGHFVHKEKPKEVAELIQKFI